MKVLITGAGGQLGLDLIDEFATDHEVVGLTRADLDVSHEIAVWDAVRAHQPDLVVHAAAQTNVDGCETDPDDAHRVNALGSWWLARACDAAGAALVLVSTDYVFNGTAPLDRSGTARPYTEFDPVDPISAYGRSKVAAEVLVRQALAEHYIVRTAWVCGARGNNFVKTMLRVGREQGAARVVTDQIGSPTFTRDLAAAIHELAVSGRYGTYHRTNSGTCSWHEFAAATFELSGVEVDLGEMTSAELDRPAPRPAFSVLSDRHSVTSGLRELPHWRDGLQRLLAELDAQTAQAPEGSS